MLDWGDVGIIPRSPQDSGESGPWERVGGDADPGEEIWESPDLRPLSRQDKNRKLRPLYDIPYMFEAREFLRKKLIGKKVRRERVRLR